MLLKVIPSHLFHVILVCFLEDVLVGLHQVRIYRLLALFPFALLSFFDWSTIDEVIHEKGKFVVKSFRKFFLLH